jgi:hypothetical protein
MVPLADRSMIIGLARAHPREHNDKSHHSMTDGLVAAAFLKSFCNLKKQPLLWDSLDPTHNACSPHSQSPLQASHVQDT